MTRMEKIFLFIVAVWLALSAVTFYYLGAKPYRDAVRAPAFPPISAYKAREIPPKD